MSVIVETRQGRLEGLREGPLSVFKGIAFAKAPVGELRFRAPEPPEPWTGVREAKAFGPACPQERVPVMSVGPLGEDCLTLNIWSPGMGGAKRPVLVWIHGGGFAIGSSAQAEYDGARLAENAQAVVVTINYRLGPLGFLYLDALAGGGRPVASNLGLRDQRAALEWVQENIAAFGGDPGNVTIFGESAGAMSVSCQLASPKAKGLFDKAIAQSGATHHCTSPDDATAVARALLGELGVSKENLSKLWELPAADLVGAARACARVKIRCGPAGLSLAGMTLIPVIDGDYLPKEPEALLREGQAGDVPLMIGTVLEEWRLFSQLALLAPGAGGQQGRPPKIDEATLTRRCEKNLPGHGRAVIEAYRAARTAAGESLEPADLFNAIETDRVFRIPAIRTAEAQGASQPATYMYRLDWKGPTFGACHATDIPFVFGTVDGPFGQLFTGGGEGARTLSKNMQGAWGQFARTGNPAHEGLPHWPAYEASGRATMVFDESCRVLERPQETERLFWDRVFS